MYTHVYFAGVYSGFKNILPFLKSHFHICPFFNLLGISDTSSNLGLYWSWGGSPNHSFSRCPILGRRGGAFSPGLLRVGFSRPASGLGGLIFNSFSANRGAQDSLRTSGSERRKRAWGVHRGGIWISPSPNPRVVGSEKPWCTQLCPPSRGFMFGKSQSNDSRLTSESTQNTWLIL